MPPPSIVLDTNVLVAAMRSRFGASYRVLQLIGTGQFELHLSVPVVLEYEEILLRQLPLLAIDVHDIATLLDYLCTVGHAHEIFFLWRPSLRDPDDEMLLELAVTARCSHIVTHNVRDFAAAEPFGIQVVTPRTFLHILGELP